MEAHLRPRLKAYIYPAPEGWAVNVPGGAVVYAGDRKELERLMVERHGFVAAEATAFVDAKMCARHPSMCDNMPGSYLSGLPLGDLASHFLVSLSERTSVSVEAGEPERRLAICHRCPNNMGLQAPGCCGTPKALETLATGVAKELGVTKPFEAGWCGTLGYNLRIAAFAAPGGSVTERDCSFNSLPDFCPYKCSSPSAVS